MSCHRLDPLSRIAGYGCGSLLGIAPAFGATDDAIQCALGTLLILQAAPIVALAIRQHRRRSARRAIGDLRDKTTHENRLALTGEVATSIATEVAQPLSLSNVETAQVLLNRLQPKALDLDLDEVASALALVGNQAAHRQLIIDAELDNLPSSRPNEEQLRQALIDRFMSLRCSHTCGLTSGSE